MQLNTTTLVTLNNLALANNDRMAAYHQAIELMKGKEKTGTDCTDLLEFFTNYHNDSRAFSNQLALLAGHNFYQPGADEQPVNMFTGLGTSFEADRSKVLALCYQGEEQTGKIYEYALNEDDIPAGTKNILMRQKDEVVRAQKILESLLQRAA